MSSQTGTLLSVVLSSLDTFSTFWVQNSLEWAALFCTLTAYGQGQCDLTMECWRTASLEVSKFTAASRKPTRLLPQLLPHHLGCVSSS